MSASGQNNEAARFSRSFGLCSSVAGGCPSAAVSRETADRRAIRIARERSHCKGPPRHIPARDQKSGIIGASRWTRALWYLTRGNTSTIREGARRVAARLDPFADHTNHARPAETNANHPDRFRTSLPIRSAKASLQTHHNQQGTSPVLSFAEPTMGGKWLEVLKEIAPDVTRVLVPFNTAATGAEYYLNSLRTTAAHLGMDAGAVFG